MSIYLVIDDDIPKRGAFLRYRCKLAIYLTYKHKRIGYMLSAPFHELIHCKSD